MVIGALGVVVEESVLRELCDCTALFGTDAVQAVFAAQQLGFADSGKYNLSFEQLADLVDDGHCPIVLVDLQALGDGYRGLHSLVLVALTQQEALVLDPLRGERTLSLVEFQSAWSLGRNLTILICR